MSFIFPETQKELKINFTSELKYVLCLKEYHIFLYFNSGQYQIWNIFKDELLVSKILPNDIMKFSIFNDTCLVYVRFDGTVKVHDIFKNSDADYFSTAIPTNLTVNFNNFGMGSEIFQQNVVHQCLIHTIQEKGLLYLVERINISPMKTTHVVSVFNPTASPQPIYQYIQEHTALLQFTYLINNSKFALWDQFFLDVSKSKVQSKKKVDPSFFYIGELENDRLVVNKTEIINNINTENSLSSIVMGIAETTIPSRIVIFENTNVAPVIKVFDIEKKTILKQVSFPIIKEPYCISNIHTIIRSLPRKDRQFSFIEVDSGETNVKIYKFEKNFQYIKENQTIHRSEDALFEVDKLNGRYSVEIEKGNFIEENPFRDMRLTLKFFRGLRSKHLSLFMLKKLNIYHIYIIKMIMDFIPE